MFRNVYGAQEYRQQDVMGASPVHLVVMAYDVAIVACEREDFVKATKAISVLRDALNFDYPDAAVGLFRLYQWCLDCIRQSDYANAIQTLKTLREAWVSVERRLSPGATPSAYAAGLNYSNLPSIGQAA